MTHRTLIKSLEPWYGQHLFVTGADPVILNVDKARIRTLDWKPPKKLKLTSCIWCCDRHIHRVSIPRGDLYLLERLGLTFLGETKNRELERRLREFP
jgi:hypothetical protein